MATKIFINHFDRPLEFQKLHVVNSYCLFIILLIVYTNLKHRWHHSVSSN